MFSISRDSCVGGLRRVWEGKTAASAGELQVLGFFEVEKATVWGKKITKRSDRSSIFSKRFLCQRSLNISQKLI